MKSSLDTQNVIQWLDSTKEIFTLYTFYSCSAKLGYITPTCIN